MINKKAALHIAKAPKQNRYKNFISLVADPDNAKIIFAKSNEEIHLWQDDFFVPKTFVSGHKLDGQTLQYDTIQLIKFIKKYKNTASTFFIHTNESELGLEVKANKLITALIAEMEYFSDVYQNELTEITNE